METRHTTQQDLIKIWNCFEIRSLDWASLYYSSTKDIDPFEIFEKMFEDISRKLTREMLIDMANFLPKIIFEEMQVPVNNYKALIYVLSKKSGFISPDYTIKLEIAGVDCDGSGKSRLEAFYNFLQNFMEKARSGDYLYMRRGLLLKFGELLYNNNKRFAVAKKSKTYESIQVELMIEPLGEATATTTTTHTPSSSQETTPEKKASASSSKVLPYSTSKEEVLLSLKSSPNSKNITPNKDNMSLDSKETTPDKNKISTDSADITPIKEEKQEEDILPLQDENLVAITFSNTQFRNTREIMKDFNLWSSFWSCNSNFNQIPWDELLNINQKPCVENFLTYYSLLKDLVESGDQLKIQKEVTRFHTITGKHIMVDNKQIKLRVIDLNEMWLPIEDVASYLYVDESFKFV